MRRIKSLGLGALMALALMAVPAGASATGGLVADSYPIEVYPDNEERAYFFSSTGVKVECQTPAILSDGTIKNHAATVPMVGAFEKCGLSGKETVNFNGCRLELHPGSENSFDIGPPGCGPITGLNFSCRAMAIGAQTGLPAEFKSVIEGGQKKVVASINGAQLKGTYSGPCGKGSMTASLFVTWELAGMDPNSGTLVGIRAADVFNGFFIQGKESENEAEQPKFAAENTPATISGFQGKGTAFEFTFPQITTTAKCKDAQLSSFLFQAAASLAVNSTFTSCSAGTAAVSVKMNSCYFTHTLANGEPAPYLGSVGIACSKEGDGIEVSHPNCLAKIPSQSLTSAAQYENGGAGNERFVEVTGAGKGLAVFYEKGLCVLLGKNQTGGEIGISFLLQGAV